MQQLRFHWRRNWGTWEWCRMPPHLIPPQRPPLLPCHWQGSMGLPSAMWLCCWEACSLVSKCLGWKWQFPFFFCPLGVGSETAANVCGAALSPLSGVWICWEELILLRGWSGEAPDNQQKSCKPPLSALCLRWILDSALLQHGPWLVLVALSIIVLPPPQNSSTDHSGVIAIDATLVTIRKYCEPTDFAAG